jgi:predicted short-subunit dehydrogenase-like oxidoreductase (DUF2520 family)
MPRKPTIAILGPGRLGSSLALALKSAGYSIREIISRSRASSIKSATALAHKVGAKASSLAKARLDADLLWLCVPDSQVSAIARKIAARTTFIRRPTLPKFAYHSSGALTSDELDPLRQLGASVASVHPLMTFVRGASPALQDVPFALEGDRQAIRMAQTIAHDLGGEPFLISAQTKPLYHAWGAFLSPLLVASLIASEQVAHAAGLSTRHARKKMMPIIRQTLANYVVLGPAGSFSGPLVRGDTHVLRRHLAHLKKLPEARAVYLALTSAALRHLPTRRRAELARILAAELRGS